MRFAIFMLGIALMTGSAAAEDCSKLTDTTLRLDCYDRAAKTNTEAAPQQEQQQVDNDGHLPGDFDVVDAEDLWASPNKFKGKNVELRNVQCFYADQNEYRCLAPNDGSPVMILAPDIATSKAKDLLEKECGTMKSVETPRCTRTIHFVPVKSDEDNVNAMMKRIVMIAPVMEVYKPAR